MSTPPSWRRFGITLGVAIAGVSLMAILAIGGARFLLGDFRLISRDWIAPPFGQGQVHQLEKLQEVRMQDVDSRFALVAHGDMTVGAIRALNLFDEPLIGDFVQAHAKEYGPWLLGTLDGRPSFVFQLPDSFAATTHGVHGGYKIVASRAADGTIVLTLTSPY